ncbi:MAG: hypothetical protein EZS28_005642 [Streblomastix strix]|uniref:Uncharacterized protein n=1 Tax=Streblomastix strix TaxID=222440 RepID=A0A5J4WWC8_9EUKA|nr:MAG: hypothetical protein EZS28_005642 [Streblomastix strix]
MRIRYLFSPTIRFACSFAYRNLGTQSFLSDLAPLSEPLCNKEASSPYERHSIQYILAYRHRYKSTQSTFPQFNHIRSPSFPLSPNGSTNTQQLLSDRDGNDIKDKGKARKRRIYWNRKEIIAIQDECRWREQEKLAIQKKVKKEEDFRFGGGLFLGIYGDYDPNSKLIDLRGMKFDGNAAERHGKSLYVAIPQVAELCQYGILGEYVKGNYSDTYSDENDLEGIPMNLITFGEKDSQNQIQIQQESKPLEPLWRILGILKSAQVVVNASNPNGKIIFHIRGQRMIPKYLSVKIFELRDKTQEEIDQEQKGIYYKYNKNNLKPLNVHSSQFPITLKHQKDNQQQISISTNLKIKQKLLLDQTNEIIYPPEDGSNYPIQIEGEIENEQKATFEMNDGSWLNYKKKIYAALISNDRNIFTGRYGIDIEEDSNAAVQLEVIIKEEEKEEEQDQDQGLPIGAIVGIAVGALAIIAVSVIIIIVAIFKSKKKKAKKPASSYGPEMRARDFPIEIQYPQNSHSLDAIQQRDRKQQLVKTKFRFKNCDSNHTKSIQKRFIMNIKLLQDILGLNTILRKELWFFFVQGVQIIV